MAQMISLELCAGAGGQAIGLEKAGYAHAALVELDSTACATLRLNRPLWNVVEQDLRSFSASNYKGIDLLAGGVPCPPFSIAGKQLGAKDERDLFPEALRLVAEANPSAIMLENVKGMANAKFDSYRNQILQRLEKLGYTTSWRVINSCQFGVPQLRPRFILVALKKKYAGKFFWPENKIRAKTVGEALETLMGARGWKGAHLWAQNADEIAPTIVGGSKKHGGPDLGPSRARQSWAELGVDGRSVADLAPGPEMSRLHVPKLTVEMVARLQGFPVSWRFSGKKTAAYKQVGNAFPPPVACAIAVAIRNALEGKVDSKLRNSDSSDLRISRPALVEL